MTIPFLDECGYWEAFEQECFYEKRAKSYDQHIRPLRKKYRYEDIAWFKIVRHRYEWEWWKDFIGVEFTGVMVFMKDAKGFQYLDHVIPITDIYGRYAEGKMIHATGIEMMDEKIEY